MKELVTPVLKEDEEAALVKFHLTAPLNQISFKEFRNWYTYSKYWEGWMTIVDTHVEEVTESTADHLKLPKDGKRFDYVCWLFLLLIIALLCFTIPNMRQLGKSQLCFVALMLSILCGLELLHL